MFLAIILPFSLVLSACQAPPPIPQEQSPPAQQVVNKAWLYPRLDAADEAIDNLHLAYPEQGSALGLYREILARYPEQEDALRGIERIVEEYVALALQAGEAGQFARAKSMLDRGRLIVPDHPSLEPTAEQIRLLSQAERKKLKLSQAQIKDRDPATFAQLAAMGAEAVNRSCRFVINAINDEQGRQIYAGLSDGAQSQRIRAQVKIRLPAGVERVCF